MKVPQRQPEGRLLAGICTALSESLAVDVTLLRLAFFVLAFAWGIGVVIYGLLWLVMPSPGMGPSDLGTAFRRNLSGVRDDLGRSARQVSRAWRSQRSSDWPVPLDRRWLAIGLIAAGGLVLVGSLGAFAWLTPTRALGLGAVSVGAAVLLRMRSG